MSQFIETEYLIRKPETPYIIPDGNEFWYQEQVSMYEGELLTDQKQTKNNQQQKISNINWLPLILLLLIPYPLLLIYAFIKN